MRTDVRHEGERGIHFIAEWISDWINSKLGPVLYGLPYRYGELEYQRNEETVNGIVRGRNDTLMFRGSVAGPSGGCDAGLEAFLLERYVAFNAGEGRQRFFRVWQEPWDRRKAAVEILGDSLMRANFDWWSRVEQHSAHVSRGVFGVKMVRPRQVSAIPSPLRDRPDAVSET